MAFSKTSWSQRCLCWAVYGFIEMEIVRESPIFRCDSQEYIIVHKSSAFRRQSAYIYQVIGE